MATTPETAEAFQLPISAAERYESEFVPNFFVQWAPILCNAANVGAGQRVLDVACGTGVVARHAAGRVGPAGHVVGIDCNQAMLTVARRCDPAIEWRLGDAAALPSDDRSFDAVLCQMALMFFDDRRAAMAEMARVVTDGGTVAVVVPSALDRQEMFRPFVDAAARIAGPEARSLLTSYFAAGDAGSLQALFEDAGLRVTSTCWVTGTYAAPSVDAAIVTEVESTPLVERISEATYERLRSEVAEVLAPFATDGGRLAAPFECLVVAGTPRPRDPATHRAVR